MDFIMAKADDRVELIGSAILKQAQQEAGELIKRADDIHDREIAAFKNEIVDEMFGKMQAKSNSLRQASTKIIAKSRLEAHRVLLSHRAKKTEETLNNVRERLIEYAQTPQYREDFLRRAEELKDSCDHAHSVILIAKKDMPLGEEIKKVLGGGSVQADAGIALGGFKLRNEKSRFLIDETLDERLEEQRLWLLENCGIKVV